MDRTEGEAMQFHEYIMLRNRQTKLGRTPSLRKFSKGMKPQQYRDYVIYTAERTLGKDWLSSNDPIALRAKTALAEVKWCEELRPYYNIWPIAIELARSVKLDVPFSKVKPTYNPLAFRFARGHEPSHLTTALLCWFEDRVFISCPILNKMIATQHAFSGDESVEDWLSAHETISRPATDIPKELTDARENALRRALLIRLTVFVGLLSRDEDMITPVVLAKDREKYESTSDANARKWIEDRAARMGVRGFDVGKKLQQQKEKSPHWRNPHLALFWTGPGRTKPIIKMRSGAVIKRVSMAEVPTGYLGPETEGEDNLDEDTAQREPVSKTKRFEILKRDEYKCQLCGRSRKDGVKLHVDHRIPRAKGGSNEDDNLWTLCEACNLGKSDSDL